MPLSKRNRRGLIILLLVCLAIALTPRLIIYLFPAEDFKISESDIALFELELENKKESRKYTKSKKYKRNYKRPSSKFDPNSYQVEDWKILGLSQKQSEIIVQFSRRGIYSNEELEKIFVLPPELFALIKDSTFFPARKMTEVKKQKEIAVVNLNSATSEELDKLPGIGQYFADKMIEYRGQLGGYISSNQLLEIWKFDAEKISAIEKYLIIDESQIMKLSINKASTEELNNHPYISYKVGNSIVKMRETHGAFSKVDDIKKSKLIDEELYAKLKPYLKL